MRGQPPTDRKAGESAADSASDTRVLSAAEFADLQRRAELGTLASVLAHEVNNIITPALNYARLARDNASLAPKAIERTIRAGERLAAMSEDVLSVGRSATSDRSEKQASCVVSVVSNAGDCLHHSTPIPEIVVDVPADLWVGISEGRLEQVLVNLLRNASRAVGGRPDSDGEPPRIGISAKRCSTGNTSQTGSIRITVEDNGVGIEPGKLATIFEPFQTFVPGEHADQGARTVSAQDHRASGTGLGLFLCRCLVESAGGTIEAQSTVGEGTRMTLTLPRAKPAFDQQFRPTTTEAA